MKKNCILTLGVICAMSAQAHEVWVDTDYPEQGKVLRANLGYGDYPTLGKIVDSRLHIFKKPVQLHTPKGTFDLIRTDVSNVTYRSEKPLADGSYLLTAEYSPTFWSENKDGWKQENMTVMKDAHYCEQTQMYGKKVINIGDSKDVNFITKPVGQGLEIVPLNNPANAEIGKPFPLKVLFNGKPLKDATLVATFKGFAPKDPHDHYHKLEPQAFSDTTRADGSVQLYPWHAGQWKLRVVHKSDYPKPNECQKLASYATLTFEVGNADEIRGAYADDLTKYEHINHEHKH